MQSKLKINILIIFPKLLNRCNYYNYYFILRDNLFKALFISMLQRRVSGVYGACFQLIYSGNMVRL